MIQNPFEARPYDIVGINPTDPAAGANLSFGVPAGSSIMPISIRFDILTDATATNRTAFAAINDGALIWLIGNTNAVIGAGAGRVVQLDIGRGSSVDVLAAAGFNFLFGSLNSHAWMRVGDTLDIGLQNIQAADQISNVWIRYAQIIDPA